MENHTSNSSSSSDAAVDPFSIILVKNGCKGDQLLFRYPYKLSRGHGQGHGLQSVKDEEDKELQAQSIKGFKGRSELCVSSNSNSCLQNGNSKSGHRHKKSHGQGQEILDNEKYCKEAADCVTEGTSNTSPTKTNCNCKPSPVLKSKRNPYAIRKTHLDGHNDLSSCSKPAFLGSSSNGNSNRLLGDLNDDDLAHLLAVNLNLCEKKFELKINEARFVGHPTLLNNHRHRRPVNVENQTTVKLFHIVFCLNARASHSIVKCFYELSKQLAIGLRHEEFRNGFVSTDMKLMMTLFDEFDEDNHLEEESSQLLARESLFNNILGRSKLAQLLKQVYDDVCETGRVRLKINNWVQISFCLPQKTHILPFKSKAPLVDEETIQKYLAAIRPYHGILLLVDMEDLLGSYWLDASSTIRRLLKIYSPLKSLQTMAADSDLSLLHVVEIASHLVYWALAAVIYPLCESNIYVLSPNVPVASPELASAFFETFHGHGYGHGISLSQTLTDFSIPMPLGDRLRLVFLGYAFSQVEFVELVTWLLKHRLLIQLHTYIYLSTCLELESYSDDIDISNLNDRLSFSEIEDYDVTEREASSDAISIVNINDVNLPSAPGVERKREREVSESTVTESDSTELMEEFIGTPAGFRELIKRAVAQVNNSLSAEDMKLFFRLCKYFNGEFHVEEIMYRENLQRERVMLLLDKFRDVIITVEMEDGELNLFKY